MMLMMMDSCTVGSLACFHFQQTNKQTYKLLGNRNDHDVVDKHRRNHIRIVRAHNETYRDELGANSSRTNGDGDSERAFLDGSASAQGKVTAPAETESGLHRVDRPRHTDTEGHKHIIASRGWEIHTTGPRARRQGSSKGTVEARKEDLEFVVDGSSRLFTRNETCVEGRGKESEPFRVAVGELRT